MGGAIDGNAHRGRMQREEEDAATMRRGQGPVILTRPRDTVLNVLALTGGRRPAS